MHQRAVQTGVHLALVGHDPTLEASPVPKERVWDLQSHLCQSLDDYPVSWVCIAGVCETHVELNTQWVGNRDRVEGNMERKGMVVYLQWEK